ncbi:PSD1 and planctomycete cytochrome C domain-containing protein [Luteolibacter sp. Populi]|uniref:PSD1 and planctomycete cytochrome C domain-containing protein n=1 Tax=Luteolibacter sp. Populi TaxID=3230487 RepID=UPI00346675FE
MNPRLQICGLAVLVMVMAGHAAEVPDFNREIRPILSDRCFACHGFDAKAREAELRLDVAEAAYADKAIVPGKPEESLVWQRITSTDPDEVMPPADSHLKLSAEEKALLKRWIEGGAPYQPHWALVKVPPQSGSVDAAVGKRLAKEGLDFAAEAPKETLVRRLSFDLRGLPPSPEEVSSFVADAAPDAWEKLVDRFLADPAYGERMAWPWLDAARYADSNGYQGDADRTMWPWRDWVVSAFNRNLPYDQFTVWQLAGDLLPDATEEQILATGFLRNHPINGEGGSIPEENRVNYAMDMAETTGTVWMALTMNCCRCHDHKYDPLKQRDYYSLMAFFNQTPVDGSGGDPQTAPALAVPDEAQRVERERLAKALGEAEQKLAERTKLLEPQQAAWEKTRLAGEAADAWQVLDLEMITGAESKILEDRSLLTSGVNPANVTYVVRTPAPRGRMTALRLEAMRHPSMTLGGIARSDSGNFVLTGFEAALVLPGGKREPLRFGRAEASFEQGARFVVGGAIDEDPQSGWAVWEGKPIERDHAAIFHLAEGIEVRPRAVIEITLRHDSPHPNHNLGRFRLAMTGEASPALSDQAPSLAEALRVRAEERSPEQAKAVREAYLKSDAEHGTLAAAKGGLDAQLKKLREGMPKVMVMADRKQRRATHVLSVGSYDKPLEEVEAATPAILPPLPKGEGPANRLDLARWLVSREHPLTARVTVNRAWQEFFGIGLIKTPEDFGVQSEVPVHPELLDSLAAGFMDSGWDYKRLVRAIVTSRTYRQSSRVTPEMLERDPANRLLARGPRFRLPAWMIRDQALATGGAMVPRIGGAPVRPYAPANLWPDATFGKVAYVRDKGEGLHRRSLYTFWRRISTPPMFFDNAKREVCTVNPSRTNTPLHALSMLNDTTYVEAARLLAVRALREDREKVLERAFRIVTGREATEEEAVILLESYRAALAGFDGESAKAFLAEGDAVVDVEAEPVEMAALASVCLSILNTDEAMTKE